MNNNRTARKLFSPNSFLTSIFKKTKLRHKILKRFGYFYNPNTLESWNCRWCQRHSDRMPSLLLFQKQLAIAMQLNLVNASARNTDEGLDEHTVETLAEKYNQGYVLDIDFVSKNKPVGIHCGPKYFRLVKT